MSEHREDSDFTSPNQLPHGWELLPLKDLMAGDKTAIKRGPFGSAIKKSFFVSGGYKVYEQKNAIYDDATLGDYFVNPEKFDELRDFEVKPGDFIVSCSGTIGRISRLPPNAQPGVINQALLKLTIDEGRVHPKYFLYLFRSHRLQQLVLKDTRGSAMKNLASVDDLKQIRLPLPPIKQQETIVAEIEKQFSRLDEAVANLKRVKANLKRYKAAVLKAAVEGKLTEAWRKAHPDVEPATELLKRILSERRTKWNGKGKYKEPKSPEPGNLPLLPEGWAWATAEQISSWLPGSIQSGPFGSQLLHSEFVTEGVLAIGIDNVGDGRFSIGANHRISKEKYSQLRKFSARPSDVLITVMATVGRVCVLPHNLEPAIVTKHCYRITPSSDAIDSQFLAIALRADAPSRWHIFGNLRGQTRPGINGPIVKNTPVPLPPLIEQSLVVAEVERRLSLVKELEVVVSTNFQRENRLRQAILQHSFSGRLRCDSETVA